MHDILIAVLSNSLGGIRRYLTQAMFILTLITYTEYTGTWEHRATGEGEGHHKLVKCQVCRFLKVE